MSAFFVTATGTDIGKTFVTAGLVRHLREIGAPVSAVKPVMSGFEMANAAQCDAGVLLDALGQPVTSDAIARISPWRFAAPLSPDMAAAREGRAIDFEALVGWCQETIARPGTIFIEGVGGVMVPLDERHTVLDWMLRLDLPLVLVTGSYLGIISHTLTAAEVSRRAGLSIAAIVMNESDPRTVPMEETCSSLRRFLPGVSIATVPRLGSAAEVRPALAKVWTIIQDCTFRNSFC